MGENEHKNAKASRENLITNGSVVNRGSMSGNKFVVNSKFWLANGTYQGEFKVTEASSDAGTDYRRILGRNEDVVVTLAYLQSQFSLGYINLLDENGDIIK